MPQFKPSLFIDYSSDQNGTGLQLGIEEIRLANALLERLDNEPEAAFEAIRAALFLRPRIFSQTPDPPSVAVRRWNAKNPPGSEVRFWPLGKDSKPSRGSTCSYAFDSCGTALVLVNDTAGNSETVSLANIEPVNSVKV